MGGCIDWSAFPHLVDLFDVQDVEMLLHELILIRELTRSKDNAEGNTGTL